MTDEQKMMSFARALCLSTLTVLTVGKLAMAGEAPLPTQILQPQSPILPATLSPSNHATTQTVTPTRPVTSTNPNNSLPTTTTPPHLDRVTPSNPRQSPQISSPPVGKIPGRVLVTIDPGHGGKDSGAIGVNNLREVDVILPIALKVAAILDRQGIATQLTRNRDYFVGLDERVVMSRQAGATLFVSIHANSIDGRPDVRGLETYHYSLGESLANTVHSTILDYFNNQKRIRIDDRRVRSARFLVLRKSMIPAILVETGYLTSPEEAPLLGDPNYQNTMAEAIAQGIIKYIQNQ